MNIPNALRYTKEHEWAKSEGKKITVGITEYAQQELGDVVFVDLPEIGKKVAKGDSLLTIESVKAVSDVYAPVSGVVVAVNEKLQDAPDLVNTSSYDDGWMVVVESDTDEFQSLTDSSGYQSFIAELSK